MAQFYAAPVDQFCSAVDTRFGHCEVLVRGYVHEVVISCAAEVIARHPRSYEQEDFVFDPLHYLSLLEQKTNALDQAAPLAGRLLPPVFGDLRRLLEARMGKAGKREYVQVLRLIESFSLDDVRAAISEALERGVIGFDAVKHCPSSKHSGRFSLFYNGGSGSSWIDVKPLCVDGSSGGFGLSVSLSFPSFR